MRTSVAKFSIYHGITRMLQMATLFFIASHLFSLKFTGVQVGAIFAASQISSLITIVPSGISNDKFKSKTLITVALILESLQYFALAFSESFFVISLFFFIGGLGHTLYKTSADSVFYRLTEKQEVPKKIATFNNATYIFIALGIILSGYLLNTGIKFQNLFLTFATLLCFMGITAQFLVSNQEKSQIQLLHYKKDLFQPKVLTILLVLFLFHSQFAVNTTSYSPFLEQNLGLSKFQTGLFMAGAILPMALITHYLSKLKTILKSRHILILGVIMAGLGNIIVSISQIHLSFLGRVINEMGNAAFFFFTYYCITKLFDLKRVGGNASIFALVGSLASAAGAQIFAPIGEKLGFQYSFLLSGAIILLSLLLIIPNIKYFDHE